MGPVAHPRVAWQMLEGEAVLIDLDRSTALGLNTSGSFLWQRLDGRAVDTLATELSAEFDVAADQARDDVAAFVAWLRERGLVEG